MKRAGWCLGLVMALAIVGAAQVPTVDNFTLEKYQKQRLAAQRDYQENYAKMGFPSPEELERQREADMNLRIQLADQLRQARLEEEKVDIERRGLDVQLAALEEARQAREASYDSAYYGYQNYPTGYYGGYSGYGNYYPGAYGRYGYGRYGYGRLGRYRGPYYGNGQLPRLGGYRATPVGAYPNYTGIPLPSVRTGTRPYVYPR